VVSEGTLIDLAKARATTTDPAVAAAIEREVCSWPDVVSADHAFRPRPPWFYELFPEGTRHVEFRFRGRELGHLHGSRVADLPFLRPDRDQLVDEGRVAAHHIYPDSGWISYWISGPEDVDEVVGLFRRVYERLTDLSRASAGRQA